MAVTTRDREEWFYSPVTQEFLQSLRSSRQDTMETWAKQGFTTELANAAALGGVQVLDQAIEIMESYRPETDATKGEE
jgi:hypothetical protein